MEWHAAHRDHAAAAAAAVDDGGGSGGSGGSGGASADQREEDANGNGDGVNDGDGGGGGGGGASADQSGGRNQCQRGGKGRACTIPERGRGKAYNEDDVARVRALMVRLGMSQADVWRACGTHQGTSSSLSNWLRGKHVRAGAENGSHSKRSAAFNP